MKPKEIFWSGLKGGLFEAKHRKAMGEAIWLFGWLCMRQSQVNESGEGLPHYGNPLTFSEIAEDTGFPASTLRKWADKLTLAGYIHTTRVGNIGLIFFIHKAKSKAKNPKPSTHYFPAELQGDGSYKRMSAQVRDKVTDTQVRPNLDGPSVKVRPNLDGVPPTDGRTHANNRLVSQEDARISNTLTPKHLSNYNTDAGDICSHLREEEKQPQPPCLEERQRILAEQAEFIKVKYGKAATVTSIRKEAIA